ELWILPDHRNNFPVSDKAGLVLAIGTNINLTGLLAD
ncbi:unnamed protein product, partial [marine sediment metagenome]